MRTSKKAEVLDSIVAIIEESGVAGVTYDAVSARSGMSKSGLIYHFPTREAMLRDVHDFMAQRWEEGLLEALGDDDAGSADAKLRANLRVSQNAATRAELMMTIDASSDPEMYALWAEKLDRWTCSARDIETDKRACQAYLVQLIADGLWAHDYINGRHLSSEQRAALVEAAIALIPTDAS